MSEHKTWLLGQDTGGYKLRYGSHFQGSSSRKAQNIWTAFLSIQQFLLMSPRNLELHPQSQWLANTLAKTYMHQKLPRGESGLPLKATHCKHSPSFIFGSYYEVVWTFVTWDLFKYCRSFDRHWKLFPMSPIPWTADQEMAIQCHVWAPLFETLK